MLEFRPKKTDLLALCHAIVEEARSLQPKANCEVITRFAPRHRRAYLMPSCCATFWETFSPTPSSTLRSGQVIFRISNSEGRTVVDVEDQGIGIPPEEMTHLFEPFHRASNVGDIQGTGLGLAIVKKSVELHGGTIEVRSDSGRRTCFTVTL